MLCQGSDRGVWHIYSQQWAADIRNLVPKRVEETMNKLMIFYLLILHCKSALIVCTKYNLVIPVINISIYGGKRKDSHSMATREH